MFLSLFQKKKITLVIGNGFDLDLKRKTLYRDFTESLHCPTSYPAPLIHYLNTRCNNNRDKIRWYDLENEFLNYYKTYCTWNNDNDIITNAERRFLEKQYDPKNIQCGYGETSIFRDLVEKYVIVSKNNSGKYEIPYLEDLKKDVKWRDREAFKKIKEGLLEYLNQIQESDSFQDSTAYRVLGVLSKNLRQKKIKVYSFNFTELPKPYNSLFTDFTYMHGSCRDNHIIMGTRKYSYSERYDYLYKANDPQYSFPDIFPSLSNSDGVIFFGHSFGKNDSQYLDSFFRKQTSYDAKKKDIVIFTQNSDSELDIKRSLSKLIGDENDLSKLYGLKFYKTEEITDQEFRTFSNIF